MATVLALAGCVTSTPTISPTAAEGATIIFESIDGPPRPVSARLARSLDQEAAARKLAVVTRGSQALYHIRGYVAAHSEGGATSLAWAFDVYDADRKRAFRLRGEERAPGASWTAADDALLQRIAATSMAQLVTFIAADRTGASAPAAAAAPSDAPTLAGMADDFRPEASGIFRVLARVQAPVLAQDSPPVPLPPQRPAPQARPRPPVLAYSVTKE